MLMEAIMAFPLPSNEPQRLAALREYRILDTAPELAYDALTGLAAQIAQCPVACIGIMDTNREWIKSKYDLPADFNELPREMNICATTICGSDVLMVVGQSLSTSIEKRYRCRTYTPRRRGTGLR